MNTVLFVLFSLCVILFLGMFHFLISSKRSGVYPPKHILRKRAGALGASGFLLFLIGILISFFK